MVKKSHFTEHDVHYSVHRTPLLDPILSQLNPIHELTLNFSTINVMLTFHLFLVLPSGHFPSDFSVCILIRPTRTISPAHLILPDLIALIFDEQCKLLSFSLCSILHHSFTSILDTNILNTVFTESIYALHL
jgi:hypothetical protein